jgi:hypothetical protein
MVTLGSASTSLVCPAPSPTQLPIVAAQISILVAQLLPSRSSASLPVAIVVNSRFATTPVRRWRRLDHKIKGTASGIKLSSASRWLDACLEKVADDNEGVGDGRDVDRAFTGAGVVEENLEATDAILQEDGEEGGVRVSCVAEGKVRLRA